MFSEKQFQRWQELNKAPTDEGRRAEIRRQVEREIDDWSLEYRARIEREEGQRQAEHVLRHARAVTQPRDVRPAQPVGVEHRADDGTVWVRKS
jgi:hypothetical protein